MRCPTCVVAADMLGRSRSSYKSSHNLSITDSKNDKRFVITIKDDPQTIGPISNKEKYNGRNGLMIGPRYTTFDLLKHAKHFVEACP